MTDHIVTENPLETRNHFLSKPDEFSRLIFPRVNPSSGRAVGTKNASLGIYAHFTSAPQSKPENAPKETPRTAAMRRGWKRLNEAARLLPGEKITECGRKPAPMAAHVEVLRGKNGASFRGLCSCDSPSCPRCAFRRAEEEQHKLRVFHAMVKQQGGQLALMTVTLSHHWGDKLADTLAAVQAVYAKAFSGRWYVALRDEWGITAIVTAWESTLNVNGWHPHRHPLLVLERPLSGSQRQHLEAILKERWVGAARQLGYHATLEHGLTLSSAESVVAEYIAKWGHEPSGGAAEWGVEGEMAKSHLKRGKLDGLTPFELLDASYGDEAALDRLAAITGYRKRDELRRWAGRYYREWFYAFKGKPRIDWRGVPADMLQALGAALESCPPAAADETQPVALIAAGDVYKLMPREGSPDLRPELQILAWQGSRRDLVAWFAAYRIEAVVLLPDDAPPVAVQMALPGVFSVRDIVF